MPRKKVSDKAPTAKKKKGDNQYSTDYIIERLRNHMVDEGLSLYTVTKPTYEGILKRIKNGDKELESALKEIQAEHWQIFERKLNDAIFNGTEINMQAFNAAVRNKKPFQTFETLELEERIAALEKTTDAK